MKKKGLITNIVKHKLQHGELPKMVCKKCGNAERFTGIMQNYDSVFIFRQGTEICCLRCNAGPGDIITLEKISKIGARKW